MYFSNEVNVVIDEIKRIAKEKGEINFKRASGHNVDQFVDLFKLYTESTYIERNGKYYIQKEGISIGSKIAPFAADMFLEIIDRDINRELMELFDEETFCVMRFVDDYLVVFDEKIHIDQIREIFDKCKRNLEFTMEEESEDGLQFLEVRIRSVKGLCWECQQRNPKPLLPYSRSHSKNIKNAIIINGIKSAVKKSCPCHMSNSIGRFRNRLYNTGYPEGVITQQSKKTLINKEMVEIPEGSRFGSFPQMHTITHRVKKHAKNFNVITTSKYDNKMEKMILAQNEARKPTDSCKKHEHSPFKCQSNVVYKITTDCNAIYIGESQRCCNT
jgi:hypothetical protein